MIRTTNVFLFLLFGGISSSTALAHSYTDFGDVDIQGSIISAACTIDIDSRDQSIDMGTIPIGEITRNGRSVAKPFSIRLTNCVLRTADAGLSNGQYFKVTFDGRRDGELIGIDGEVKGIALQVSDDLGNVARPGIPLPSVMLTSNEKILNYSLYLVPNYQDFRSGEYRTTVRFKMDYY